MAVSVVLVALAGLSLAHVRAQRQIDTGIDLDHLAYADVDFGTQRYAEDRVRQMVDAALGQLRAAGGVDAAAASSGLPFGITTPGAGISGGNVDRARSSELVAATPGIFDVLGVRIVRGRAFDDRDSASSAPVIVIDERTAAELFGDTNPLGRPVTVQRRRWVGEEQRPQHTLTVIGVAHATSAGSIGSDGGVAYLPLAQHYEPRLVLTARAADATATAGLLRRTLASIDPDLAVTQSGTGETFLGELTLFFRVVAGLSSVLGTLALTVALAGLFGVLSHLIASRTRELGIRIALGAGTRRVQRMVLREGLSPVPPGGRG